MTTRKGNISCDQCSRYQLDSVDDADNYQGLAFMELYRKCRSEFLVASDLALRAQLTEFRDHKLIRSKKGADGGEYLTIPLDKPTLSAFLENIQNKWTVMLWTMSYKCQAFTCNQYNQSIVAEIISEINEIPVKMMIRRLTQLSSLIRASLSRGCADNIRNTRYILLEHLYYQRRSPRTPNVCLYEWVLPKL